MAVVAAGSANAKPGLWSELRGVWQETGNMHQTYKSVKENNGKQITAIVTKFLLTCDG